MRDKFREIIGERDSSWGTLFFRPKQHFVKLNIRSEEIDIARAEVFIADINSKTRGAFEDFTVIHLVHLLYADFLHQIRENLNEVKIDASTVTFEDTARGLFEKRRMYFPRPNQTEAFDSTFSVSKWTMFEIQLRKEAVQRGAVFLFDAERAFPKFKMSLEELISILFVDFVKQLRRGNQQVLVNALIDRFYSHGFDY